ncbi:hypothetical protein ACEUZ9_001120 [Paracoccus litorisediminis]|uniref:hypothetical protein n=1 Tax=Paracoccus litorisediminis TaxID=2006130 RepID=UPI00372F9B68
MHKHSEAAMKAGQRRVREALPRLKVEILGNRLPTDIGLAPNTRNGNQMCRHLRMRNIHALVIYSRGAGWLFDIVLRGMPLGVANTIVGGNGKPFASKAEAEERGLAMLRAAVVTATDNTRAKSDMGDDPEANIRWFNLHGCEIQIPATLLEGLDEALAALSASLWDHRLRPTAASASTQLRIRLVEMFGTDTFVPEIWNQASDQAKLQIAANFIQLMAMGHDRYPLPQQMEMVS